MITDFDMRIIRHLESYKYGTIGQLERIFYRNQQYSYHIVRKRLEEIKKAGYIKVHHDEVTNRNIYIYNDPKIKPPSLHRIKVLDVLAELVYCGFEIDEFSIEKEWADGKYRSDAFAIFSVPETWHNSNNFGKRRRYHMFVEVQLSNNHHGLDKYDKLFDTNAVQAYLQKNFYPNRILLISDKEYPKIILNHAQVVQLDTKLYAFPTIIL